MQSIVCGFFDIIGSILNAILPNMNNSGMSNITQAIAYFVNLISVADYFIPVSTIFTVTGIIVTYKLFMFSVWVANKVITLIRG